MNTSIRVLLKRIVPVGLRCGTLLALINKALISRSTLTSKLKAYFLYRAYRVRQEPSAQQLSVQKQQATLFAYRPLISVLIPVYQIPQAVLQALLISLEQQTYTHWQACIVWADSNNVAGWQWLQNRTKADQRFKLQWLAENRGISNNSNAALQLVTGKYVALLDHDDLLTDWALFSVVERVQNSPELDFIYSDQDLIMGNGRCRLAPFFRPGWSPEMLNSANYLTHLNVIRTRLLRDIGGWRSETDGAQDWDLFLRLSEHTKNIARIPSILYHWRMIATSTALNATVKPYVPAAQLKTLQDAFLRRGLMPSITPEAGRFHIHWPTKPASMDIVLFQSGTLAQLVALVAQVCAQQNPAINRIVVVHTAPVNDELLAFKQEWGNRYLTIHCQHANWRTALRALPLADRAQTVLLLDGRAHQLSPDCLQELSGWVVHHPDLAWSSAIAISPTDLVYEAGRVVSQTGASAPLFQGMPFSPENYNYLGAPSWYRNTRACSPYAVALRADTIATAWSSITAEDDGLAFTQFCLALLANGQRGLINPFAKIYFEHPPERQWPNEGELYHEDPYFHPTFKQVSPFKLK